MLFLRTYLLSFIALSGLAINSLAGESLPKQREDFEQQRVAIVQKISKSTISIFDASARERIVLLRCNQRRVFSALQLAGRTPQASFEFDV